MRTAVRTLTHPGTGRTVTLVGTMHVGDPGYFRELSEVVEDLAESGAEVHVEGISHRARDRMSYQERRRLVEADRWADPERAGATVAFLRAEAQGVQLCLPDDARNVDLSHVELLRRVGWKDYRRLFAPLLADPRARGLGPVVRAVMRFRLRHGRRLERLALCPSQRRVNRVVIGERNQIAQAGAADALTRGDVVLVWGADHLPGLARLFAADGYRLRRERWFEACTI